MNAQRRKKLQGIEAQLNAIVTEIENIKDEEQEAFDNLSESLQGGEKGQAMEANVEHLDEAANAAGEAANHISEIE